MDAEFHKRLTAGLAELDLYGLGKVEHVIESPQGGEVTIDGRGLVNLCANNYLGLASDPRVIEASIEATRRCGAGTASVRFICGTLGIHKDLETALAAYLGFEDAILFAAAFDANGGVFEPLLSEEDAVISDMLNHASIIDGVRLSKARRYRFAASDMTDLECQLQSARADGARTILIATDGVFSMDGTVANLSAIVDLAVRYGALTLVDDCHATGVLGPRGRGSAAHSGVEGQIDILTGTLGKALGGAMGGFVAASKPIVETLRQRARPYLFSNALAPSVCGAALAALAISNSIEGDDRRARMCRHAADFRGALTAAGFSLLPGGHPITPVMLGDARNARRFAQLLFERGVLATSFAFPVVPRNEARIRTQMSAALSEDQVGRAANILIETGRELGIIS